MTCATHPMVECMPLSGDVVYYVHYHYEQGVLELFWNFIILFKVHGNILEFSY